MEQLGKFAAWLTKRDRDLFGDEEDDEDLEIVLDERGRREESLVKLLQQYGVLFEYEKLPDLVPPGMYVLPSFDSCLTWHGTLFVRHGLYRGGVFKFELRMPEDYPESPPSISFFTSVFHPMVDPNTGAFDLEAFFPEWLAGRDYASCALPHLHRALLRREYFAGSRREPLNAEARELFLNSPDKFAERARACVSNSIAAAREEPSTGFALTFSEAEDRKEPQREILNAMRRTRPTAPFEERKSAFLDWFKEEYGLNPAGSTEPPETPLKPPPTRREAMAAMRASSAQPARPRSTQARSSVTPRTTSRASIGAVGSGSARLAAARAARASRTGDPDPLAD